MLGTRQPQQSYFDTAFFCEGRFAEDSFYGFLAAYRDRLFSDQDFASMYVLDNGRPSVAPSLMALATLLQCHDRVSDLEAWNRAQYDLRWTYALGIPPMDAPFSKATLQTFRAKLILNETAQLLFQRSLDLAVSSGFLKGRKLRVAVDTTPIFGAAAVKDTYNLLADGIRKLIRAFTSRNLPSPEEWAAGNGYARYFAGSIKGGAEVDWEDEASRREFLRGIVDDAVELVRWVHQLPDSEKFPDVIAAANVLQDLVQQDVEDDGAGPKLRQGVARHRVISAHDPEMRHGRKSASQRFNGYKGAIGVDTESGLITAVDVVPAGTYDGDTGLPLVIASEKATGSPVEETIGDAAFGDALTREAFHAADRTLVARVPKPSREGRLPKDDFAIDLDAGTCTCPAGHVTSHRRVGGFRTDRRGTKVPNLIFQFPAELCIACPLSYKCTRGWKGRTIQVHPREMELRRAKALQDTPGFKPYKKARQKAEHRLARLKQLGAGKARYMGLRKTRFQFGLTAAVANLTLLAGWIRATAPDSGGSGPWSPNVASFAFSAPSDSIQTLLHAVAGFLT